MSEKIERNYPTWEIVAEKNAKIAALEAERAKLVEENERYRMESSIDHERLQRAHREHEAALASARREIGEYEAAIRSMYANSFAAPFRDEDDWFNEIHWSAISRAHSRKEGGT